MRILYIDCFLGFDASMLLGALIDAGANAQKIEDSLLENGISASIYVKNTERSSIHCKEATVISNEPCEIIGSYEKNEIVNKIFKQYIPTTETSELSVFAVMLAVKQLNIEYIITSGLHLSDSADSIVINILKNASIDVLAYNENTKPMQPADAFFLACIVNESGPKPEMEIVSVGYGAGGKISDEPNIINAVIGEFQCDNLFKSEEAEELYL